MMMGRVMCVLAVVLCCACGYTSAVSDWEGFPYVSDEEKKQALWLVCKNNSKATIGKFNCTHAIQPPGDTKPLPTSKATVGGPDPGSTERTNTVVDGKGHQQDGGRLEVVKAPGSPLHEDASGDPVAADEATGRDAGITSSSGSAGTLSNTSDNCTPVNSTPNQQSPDITNQSQGSNTSAPNSTSGADSQETNSTILASTTNTTTEAPTTTPSPVPNAEISSSIASSLQNKANGDSSVNPVWMRTAAPLLIVAVLVSVTVY
ncbi:uncharacterized protein TM35_001121050 [Trypanosoma theileri]|uniref:Mucin TcMUCII n=1 Tax=Trypanosoma theileri TaxID=67003 RepID=A0A1X0NEJ0_9TRYP|nr:uncharacterized protein TM35_001121050 [Trypanosoma theileri]ORC81588.1 hypothetical protein TM35_001121050 [Trypanosoma theileri]